MIRGSSSQTAAKRKSRNGAMIPPKSHKPEQSETPKFLQSKKIVLNKKYSNKCKIRNIFRYLSNREIVTIFPTSVVFNFENFYSLILQANHFQPAPVHIWVKAESQ